MKVIPETYRAH